MPLFRVNIVRFVDEHQPGFVACEFMDSEGHRHTLIDKVPIFTADDIWSDSSYPHPGMARCEVLEQLEDGTGRQLARVTIAIPDHLKSESGLSEFLVLESQLLYE